VIKKIKERKKEGKPTYCGTSQHVPI